MIDLFPPPNDPRLHPRSPNRGDKGTYVSTFEHYQGLDFDTNPLSCIVEKKSRSKLNENNWDKVDFLEMLQLQPHPHLLVPNNIIAIPGKRLVEYYDYYFDPTISDISFAIKDALRSGKLDARELIEVFTHIADGLSYIHDSGYVHQDVRRPNVLLVRTGNGIQAKLFDYGAVRRPYFQEEGEDSWNVRPPEEKEGGIWITPRQDVYMLGRLFCNTLPRDNTQAPGAYTEIINQALERKPEDRQANAGVVRDALERISRTDP